MADNDQQTTNSETENVTVTSIHVGTDDNEIGVGSTSSDVVDTGGGDDIIYETGGSNIIDTGSGNDGSMNVGGTGWDIVMGGSGNDSIIGPSNGFLNARGGSGRDIIIGGNNTDYIFGDEGDDSLIGGGGDDYIVGGEGDDWIVGGTGNDTFVYGKGDGDDIIIDFGVGNDVLNLTKLGGTITFEEIQAVTTVDAYGNAEIDLSQWGGGTITLFQVDPSTLTAEMFSLPTGEAAGDSDGVFQDPDVSSVHLGTSGDDVIDLSASATAVYVTGGEGNDTITTGAGSDTLIGGEGQDTLIGNAGDDLLMGGEGNDNLDGGEGDDWLIGGEGDDTLTGGAGSDTFVFSPGQGNDTITDFTVDEDEINLMIYTDITSFDDLTLKQDGLNAVIDLTSQGGGKIVLEGVNVNDLDEFDFAFHTPPADSTESDGI